VFGSVILPLDMEHTEGTHVSLKIVDDCMNVKGLVRLAATWEVAASGAQK
jgi:hypothetical protein